LSGLDSVRSIKDSGMERAYEQYGYGLSSAGDHGRPPPHPISNHSHYSINDWNSTSYRGYGTDQVNLIARKSFQTQSWLSNLL